VRRVVALVVAVGLVVGAWYLRREVIDEDTGASGSTTTTTTTPTHRPTLICATEVAAACGELRDVRILRIEQPGVTADHLAEHHRLEADGWLVSQPWPAMVRKVTDSPLKESDVLARSPLVVVTTTRRPAGLDCPDLSWTCLANFARTHTGFAHEPGDTGGGLLAEHGIASGLLGTVDYASNDFDVTDGFRSSYAPIEGAVDDTRRPGDLVTVIQTAPGSYSAVAALGADAAVSRPGFEVLSPTPQITADVVLAGHADRFDAGRIRDALFATGWWQSGDKRLPGANGLPKPGVMVALRALSS
jgi:hypothetical protein